MPRQEPLTAKASKLLALLLLCLALPTCIEHDVCGNSSEIWIHLAVQKEEDCIDCISVAFTTPIAEGDSFEIRLKPDHVIARCDIEYVEVRPDGLALTLTREAYESMKEFREVQEANHAGQLAVLTLGSSDSPFAVLQLEDLRRRLAIFDLGSEEQINRFIESLGAPEEALWPAPPPQLEKPKEREAAAEAEALLRQLEQDAPILDQLRQTPEGHENDEVIRDVVEALKRGGPGS